MNQPCYAKAINVRRILVLEDYGPTRQALALTLRRAGWHVDVVQSAHEALTVLQQHTYDVLLFDVNGPTDDVWGALTVLQQLGNSTPLVILGYTESVYLERIRALLPCVLLTKPLSRQALLRGISAALKKNC